MVAFTQFAKLMGIEPVKVQMLYTLDGKESALTFSTQTTVREFKDRLQQQFSKESLYDGPIELVLHGSILEDDQVVGSCIVSHQSDLPLAGLSDKDKPEPPKNAVVLQPCV